MIIGVGSLVHRGLTVLFYFSVGFVFHSLSGSEVLGNPSPSHFLPNLGAIQLANS